MSYSAFPAGGSPSNVTRVYDSNFRDAYPHSGMEIRMPKVDIVARHRERVDRRYGFTLLRVQANIAEAMLDPDLIFCCTDEHWGRSIVNQIGY